MSLVEHAEREMKLAGLDKPDSDYGGMIYEAVMKLVKTHAEEGHSGGSHYITMKVFNEIINFKPLAPINSTPNEWMEVGTDVWQNIRKSTLFSVDAGKTYYDLDDRYETNFPNRSLFKRVKNKIRKKLKL